MNISNYTSLFVTITILIVIYSLFRRNKFFLNVFRVERYESKDYIQWLKNNRLVSYPKEMIIPLIIYIIITCIFIISSIYIKEVIVSYIIIVVWIILMLVSIKYQRKIGQNILLFSKRLKRLIIFSLIVSIIEILIIVSLYMLVFGEDILYYPLILLGMTIIYLEVPYNILLANFLVKPVEANLYKKDYELAYEKLSAIEELKTIGITGSFGKTTTKMITSKILENKFNILKSEEYNNSIKDIIRIINDKLNRSHKVFIIDMAAKNIGDIEEIAKLTKPQIGILTGIKQQNLEAMNNMENIMKVKYELIEELPTDGIAIFNYDNKYIKKLADKTFKEKILYGIENPEELDFYATDIKVYSHGTSFILQDKEGERIECRTKLLGRDNILNILAATATAKVLGLSLDEICKAIESIEPFPKRLELVNKESDIIEIDDRYITGAKETNKSIEIVNDFDGRKIIVTPGIFEIDRNRKQDDIILGNNIAKIFDYVILVGKKQTRDLYEGLLEEAFSKEYIIVVNSMEEAKKRLSKLKKSGDVVLWENEFPSI